MIRREARHELAVMTLCLLFPSAALAQTNSTSLASLLDERVPAYLEEFTTPGAAVALIRDGRVVFQRGYGRAGEADEDAVTAETGFNIGSISKTVAAWGVMRLVERGVLEIDAPVEKYLTRWAIPDSEFDAGGVTVRRLLSHTAGLSLSGYPGWDPGEELPTLEASLSGATNGSGDVHLMSEPGTEWRYSGGGFTLLQLLVEEVTGRAFADYMRDEVLRPLGMESSDYEITPEIAAGSSLAFDRFGEPTPSPRFTALAAAGLHTTLEDLATFAVAALEGPADEPPGRGILDPETVALMTTPVPVSDGSYGLGYGVESLGEELVMVGHNGANRGWHAAFLIVPETGSGFVVVTNGSNGWPVHRQIRCDWIEEQTGTRPRCEKPIGTYLIAVLLDGDGEAAVRRYRALKRESPEEYHFDEWELNGLGYELLSRDRIEDAIEIFELNVEEYPQASNPFDSLGEAYMIAGETERAIQSYRKSLELDPANENAARKLEELESS